MLFMLNELLFVKKIKGMPPMNDIPQQIHYNLVQ
mgnify:CR=1 FL=1